MADDEQRRSARAERARSAKPAETTAPPAALNAETMPAIVETAIQVAIRQGQFDDLPGAGKPIPGLGDHHDPDWWIRRKIERENLTGLGPPALMLRVEDRELDAQLDGLRREEDVRAVLEDFNRRVIEARRQLLGGPPVVTKPRDVDDHGGSVGHPCTAEEALVPPTLSPCGADRSPARVRPGDRPGRQP